MDKSELVVSIVLNNDNAFHYLSAQEIAMFMASCKNAYESKALQKMRNKHRAWDLYYNAWYIMEEAYLALKNYCTMADLDFSRKLFTEHKAYVRSFENECDDIKDCLAQILIAEYKEFVFDMANDNVANSSYYDELFLLQQFEKYMLISLTFCDVTKLHNPLHYAFAGLDKDYYQFYTQIERHGVNTLQETKCKKYLEMIKGEDDSNED